jgi:hypothetical protein
MFQAISIELGHIATFIVLITILTVACWGLLVIANRRDQRKQEWRDRMYDNAKHTSKHRHGR